MLNLYVTNDRVLEYDKCVFQGPTTTTSSSLFSPNKPLFWYLQLSYLQKSALQLRNVALIFATNYTDLNNPVTR